MAKYGLAAYNGYVYVKYTHQNQRFRISTSFSSEELWDPVTKMLDPRHDQYIQAKRVTDTITHNMITAAQRVITAGYEPSAHLVRQEYYKVLESFEAGEDPPEIKKEFPEFYQMWHEFMKVKAAEMQPDGFRSYTQLYGLLRDFEAFDDYEMDFHTFDLVMFGRLKQYMFLVKRYADATTQKLVKKLRAFYRWAVPTMDISFMKFTPVNVMNINPLEPGELHYLIDADLGGYIDKARDLFVFCCATGMRYRDSQRFDETWIRDGLIEYTQSKTAQEAMVPMLNAANKILVKWGRDTPKMEVQPYNRHLKDLFRYLEFDRLVKVYEAVAGRKEVTMVPFWSQVGSHTARKTFITYALYRGVPIQDVMKMSGHTDYETMKAYIAISREHIKAAKAKFDI